MAHHGEADGYYNDQSAYQQYPQPPQAQQYQQPPQAQYQPPQQYSIDNYNRKNDQNHSQDPPTYGATFVPPQNNKQDFQQTFKITKPKWNDLWAGILVG
jgi:hypothetical protein